MSDYKWDINQELSEVPDEAIDFCTKSDHGALFQSPQWVADVEQKPNGSMHLYATSQNKIVFSALVHQSRIPGVKWFAGTVRRGPVFSNCEDAIILWDQFEEILLEHKIFALTVAPYWEESECQPLIKYLEGKFYFVSDINLDHSDSLINSLNGDENVLFSQFSKSKRQDIRKSIRRGLEVRPAKSDAEWRNIWRIYRKGAKHKGFGSLSLTEFQNLKDFSDNHPDICHCLVTVFKGKPMGGNVILRHGNRAVVFIGFSDKISIKGISKDALALWEAIKWAKATGAVVFDHGGITPNAAPGTQLEAINRYKKAFSKTEIQLFKPRIRIFKPDMYKLYTYLRAFKHMVAN